MPCSDVTEVIRVRLDGDDRLLGYELIKRTCGRAVGERGLLVAELKGLAASAILSLGHDDFLHAHPAASEEEEFLSLKHLFAVQGTLRTLLGEIPGGALDDISVAAVSYDGEETVIEAELAVDVITEQIRSCGRCKGCAAFATKPG